MWPLTSLSVLKDGTNVPGWVDHSPEELRVAAYSAKLSGGYNYYRQFYENLLREAKEKRKVFLHPTKKAEKVVWDMLKQANENSSLLVSTVNTSFSPTNSLPFGSSAAPSAFGNASHTVTMGASNNLATCSIFGYNPENDPVPGLFSSASMQFGSNSIEVS